MGVSGGVPRVTVVVVGEFGEIWGKSKWKGDREINSGQGGGRPEQEPGTTNMDIQMDDS